MTLASLSVGHDKIFAQNTLVSQIVSNDNIFAHDKSHLNAKPYASLHSCRIYRLRRVVQCSRMHIRTETPWCLGV